MAWHIAALSRMEKLPKLQTLLVDRQPARQTRAEQLAMMRTLSEQYGLTLLEKKVH